ncbi:hypothetical protein DEO72_LG2g3012 [Vigna unguiculata]|uniref:Uncharacterized protein n=1 Tax=Vigna unguiculata TaxID=3917 RepID=A0A4D6L2D6_VIGUN|nr:hypothetical protein DEO72_LG2g3012 [Vigna unguiculata]
MLRIIHRNASTLIPATLANPSHNSRVSRVHPPSRATTQEMLFRATTQGIPHYQTRQPTTEKGNLSGPIRTGHNQHTHTGNTRQPEPQLKGFSCSSAIPSHNSRDAIPSHNSRNTTCLTPIPSHNSRDTFRATTQGTPATSPLKHYQKPCRTPCEVQQLGLTAAKSPSGGHVPLGATTSRPPGGGHVPPGAKRPINHKFCNYRLAEPFPSPGRRCSRDHEFLRHRLAEPPCRQASPAPEPHCCLSTAWRT